MSLSMCCQEEEKEKNQELDGWRESKKHLHKLVQLTLNYRVILYFQHVYFCDHNQSKMYCI